MRLSKIRNINITDQKPVNKDRSFSVVKEQCLPNNSKIALKRMVSNERRFEDTLTQNSSNLFKKIEAIKRPFITNVKKRSNKLAPNNLDQSKRLKNWLNNFVFLPTDSKKELSKTLIHKPINSPVLKRRIKSPDVKSRNFMIMKLDKNKTMHTRGCISPVNDRMINTKHRRYIVADKEASQNKDISPTNRGRVLTPTEDINRRKIDPLVLFRYDLRNLYWKNLQISRPKNK